MKRHAIILCAVLLTLATALSFAQAPVPFINLPLLPDATAPGGPHFILTVNGTGFVSNSVVRWNGTQLTTKFLSSSQLTAVVPATNIATASTANVTVVNPAPGGGTSNVAFFSVNAAQSAGFMLVSSWTVGESPVSVAVGDFNGDGKMDIATANGNGTVSILLGDGTGNFTLASSPHAGNSPVSVAVGDFNRDGKLDVATANSDSTISILLGDGTGNFSLASSAGVGSAAIFVAAGDFNRDGNLDLAVATADNLSILLGDGTGNFNLSSSLAGSFNSVAVGDFDGDGKLDLAVADGSEAVLIMTGDGTGNFTMTSSVVTGYVPDALATGDFNEDGSLDLAAANYCGEIEGLDCNPGTITMVLGGGRDYWTYLHNYFPVSMAAGDFNGDGHLDLAVVNQCGSDRYCNAGGTVSILPGDGMSNFTVASSPAAGNRPTSIAVGDFNGDGKVDLAVANSDGVSILLWDPRALTFSPTGLTFGTQLIGSASVSQPVTLTNIGSQRLRISSIVASTNFSQTNNCGSSVAASASCTINATFQPNGTGTLAGAITITDNAANRTQSVSLTGVGTAVTLLPTGLAFGSYTVGTISSPHTVILTNYGSAALNIQSIHISGSDPLNFAQTNNCGTTVPARGTCTVSLTFTPKDLGKKTAKLFVADDGGASPQKVSLTGTGK